MYNRYMNYSANNTSNTNMKNCLIYARVSSAKQAQQGESLSDQESVCRMAAERRGLNVVKVFTEQFSGRKNDRPVIEDIINYIKLNPNKIDYLLFKSIDRISRNGTHGYEEIKQKLAKYKVEMIDANSVIQPSVNTLEHLGVEYPWSKTRPSEITEMVIAQQGQGEVNTILTRLIGAEVSLVRDGYKVRQANDGFVNEKIYVDGKKKVVHTPDPARAHFFIKMFKMSATNTDKEIVDHVNAAGYLSKVTHRWSKDKTKIMGTRGGVQLSIKHLQEIRQRPIYAGVNTEIWLDKPSKTKYAGLVSVDVFNRANKGKVFIKEEVNGDIKILRDYNPHQLKRMKDNPEFPHKSVVLCSICEKPFLGSSPKGKLNPVPTYHCARDHKYLGINKKDFEKNLSSFVSKLEYKDERFMKAFEEVLMNKFREKEKELGEFSVQVGATVTELEKEKIILIDSYISTKNEIVKAELDKKINAIHAKIEEVRSQRNNVEVQENDIHAFIKYVKILMEHPVEILVNQRDSHVLRSLFSVVFDQLPTYSQILNGTPKLSLPYRLVDEFKENNSLLVSPLGIEPRFKT